MLFGVPRLAIHISALVLLTVCACATPRAPATAARGAGDADSDIPDGWLDGLPPDDASVPTEEANAVVERIFGIIDQKIFDPGFKKEERDRAREQLLLLAAKPTTRKALATEIDAALKRTGMSHLRLLRPEQVRKLEAMTAAASSTDRDGATVGSERSGDVGVLRLASFLVPSIRRELLEQALAKIEGSKALLIDLRGNGGGSMSSAVYLLDHVLGPDHVVAVTRFRGALRKARPFVQRGGFPDEANEGSAADVALERTEGLVEWRTSPTARSVTIPVYALIDGRCGSSCDTVAAALRDHHAARLLGATTAGALLMSAGFRPPWKGHVLLVPEGMVYSPAGAVIEGHGVAPDVELGPCAEDDGPACLEAALAIVRRDLAGQR